jgi:hypothetical protein
LPRGALFTVMYLIANNYNFGSGIVTIVFVGGRINAQ